MDQKTRANLRFFIYAILMSIPTTVDDNKLMETWSSFFLFTTLNLSGRL